jgi:hypothetical protein
MKNEDWDRLADEWFEIIYRSEQECVNEIRENDKKLEKTEKIYYN